jgi:hypothetical protein
MANGVLIKMANVIIVQWGILPTYLLTYYNVPIYLPTNLLTTTYLLQPTHQPTNPPTYLSIYRPTYLLIITYLFT